MAFYEYQVVPAPTKGVKVKGVRAREMRFSLTLQDLMNEMGAEGWEYQRAETLPSVERSGLTGSTTNWRHVLVFRRELLPEADLEDYAEVSTPAPVVAAPEPEHVEPEVSQDPVGEDDTGETDRPPLIAERN